MGRAIGGYATLAVALLRCPGNVPLLLALLAGTSVGALLSQHLTAGSGVLVALFALTIYVSFKLLRTPARQPPTPNAIGPDAGGRP